MPRDTEPVPPEGTDSRIAAALDRLHKGDPTAKNDLLEYTWTQLVRMSRKLLRGVPDFAIVRQWDQTDDVVQGLMLRMSSTIDHIDQIDRIDRGKILSVRDFFGLASKQIRWELKTLRDKYLAQKRGAAKLVTNGGAAQDGGSSNAGGGVEQVEARPDEFAEMNRYLERIESLSPAEQEMIDLIVIHSLTRKEAAARLGMARATFNRKYREVCDRLRHEILEEEKRLDE